MIFLRRSSLVWVYDYLCLTGYGVTFPFLFTQYKMLTYKPHEAIFPKELTCTNISGCVQDFSGGLGILVVLYHDLRSLDAQFAHFPWPTQLPGLNVDHSEQHSGQRHTDATNLGTASMRPCTRTAQFCHSIY
jgi:hypothetical protein